MPSWTSPRARPTRATKVRVKPVVLRGAGRCMARHGDLWKAEARVSAWSRLPSTATQLTRSAAALRRQDPGARCERGTPPRLTALVSHALDPRGGRQASERRGLLRCDRVQAERRHGSTSAVSDGVPREPMDSPGHERVHARSPEACSIERREPARVIVTPMCPRPSSVRVRTGTARRKPGQSPVHPVARDRRGGPPRGRARRRLFAPPSH
jgi:hypothetical protein